MESKYDPDETRSEIGGQGTDFFELADILPGFGAESSVIARAAEWFSNGTRKQSSLTLLTDFADENCHIFRGARLTMEEDDGEGQKIEYSVCYDDYLQVFEESLEEFIEESGSDIDTFRYECSKVLKGQSVTLFDDESHLWFLNLLLSSLDYRHFHDTMVLAERKQSRRSHK